MRSGRATVATSADLIKPLKVHCQIESRGAQLAPGIPRPASSPAVEEHHRIDIRIASSSTLHFGSITQVIFE